MINSLWSIDRRLSLGVRKPQIQFSGVRGFYFRVISELSKEFSTLGTSLFFNVCTSQDSKWPSVDSSQEWSNSMSFSSWLDYLTG